MPSNPPGRDGLKRHSAFHRVFSAARWSLDQHGLAVFSLIEPWLGPDPELLRLGDTLARKRGARLPTPRQMLAQRTRRLTLDIYGRRDRSRVADQVARVHAVPDRPLRIVAVEPLTGGRRMQAFYSTCHQATAEQVLTWYAMRWSIEQTFHDAKGHLGFEQPQGWSRQAVQRTAPTAMLLYSLIVLWFAAEGHHHYRAPKRPWCRSKACASFADMLNTLRCESIRRQVLSLGLRGRGSKNILRTLFNAVQQVA